VPLSEPVVRLILKFTYIVSTSCSKLKLIFHEVFVINVLFPPLHKMLYASRIKLLLKHWSLSHKLCSSVVHKMVSSEWILQGVEKMKVGGCQISSVGGDEGKQSISLLQVPPLCKTGVRPGIVMVDEDLIHLSVWLSPSTPLFYL